MTEGPDPDAPVDVRCDGCGSVYTMAREVLVERVQRGRTRCLRCAGELSIPEELRAARVEEEEVRTRCPCCASFVRATRAGGNLFDASCVRCRFRFAATSTGEARVLLPRAPLADEDAVPELPDGPVHDVIRRALVARARRRQLGREELEELVDALQLLAAWQAPSPERLVLPLRPPLAREALKSVLLTGYGFAEGKEALLLIAGGVQFHVDVLPHDEGTEIRPSIVVGASRQPLPPERLEVFARQLGSYWRELLSYLTLLALFGEGARGPAPVHAREGAIAARLDELGVTTDVVLKVTRGGIDLTDLPVVRVVPAPVSAPVVDDAQVDALVDEVRAGLAAFEGWAERTAPDRVEARLAHLELEARLEALAAPGTGIVALRFSGALPPGPRFSLRALRGLLDRLRNRADAEVGIPDLDERFLIHADPAALLELRELAPELLQLETHSLRVDGESFSWAGESWRLAESTAVLASMWTRLAERRVGVREDPPNPT